MNNRLLIILFTSDFYKYYYALNLATTYQACNKNVTVFFTGYACNFLKKQWKKYDSKKNYIKIIKKNMPNYLEILKICRELNVNFYYCTTAINFLDIKKSQIIDGISIEPSPLYHMVNKHKKNNTLFI